MCSQMLWHSGMRLPLLVSSGPHHPPEPWASHLCQLCASTHHTLCSQGQGCSITETPQHLGITWESSILSHSRSSWGCHEAEAHTQAHAGAPQSAPWHISACQRGTSQGIVTCKYKSRSGRGSQAAPADHGVSLLPRLWSWSLTFRLSACG